MSNLLGLQYPADDDEEEHSEGDPQADNSPDDPRSVRDEGADRAGPAALPRDAHCEGGTPSAEEREAPEQDARCEVGDVGIVSPWGDETPADGGAAS
jgi:hypothetical protein